MSAEEKPEGYLEILADLIRAKFNYENANKALKKKFGDVKGALDGGLYRDMKNKLIGGDKVDSDLDDLGARKQPKDPKAKPKPAWTKQKQSASDNSRLAKIVNLGLYQAMMPFCANRQLKEEHVQEINPGGAVVANIQYYFPGTNLEHPLVLLGIRGIIMYIKFKSVCGRIQKVVKGEPTGGAQSGLKPGMQTVMRK